MKKAKASSKKKVTAKAKSKRPATSNSAKAAAPIDAGTSTMNDWRVDLLAQLRAIILQSDPEITEEVKWRKPSNSMQGVPVWSCGGTICTGETYKTTVKLTFAQGASLEDPKGLFNSSLEGNTRRAIDFREGDPVHASALKALVRAAIALNASA
jgi:hypothetical protein